MQVDGCQLRYERLDDLRAVYAAMPESWLTDAERVELARLKDEGRRHSWLAGRWLAKQTILDCCEESLSPDSITILTRNELGQADRPRVTINGSDFKLSLSISHTDRGVLVAICESPDDEIGIDLCEEKLATTGFLATWYTESERVELESLSASEPTVYWAIKEAVYKARQRGESFKPRNIEISHCQDSRYTCHYEEKADTVRRIVVDRIDGQIAVVVIAEKTRIPLAV